MSNHPNDLGVNPDDWIYCWACDGEGSSHDCMEDVCCCADPENHHRVTCAVCSGDGGWRRLESEEVA